MSRLSSLPLGALRLGALPLGVLSFGLLASGCGKAPPPANPEFNDAVVYAFTEFEGQEVDLAYAVRALEEQIYLGMDVEANSASDRALTQADLSSADVEGIDSPDRDPALCLPVALAGLSDYVPDEHTRIQLLADQTPVEPYSPDKYDRNFLEGQNCWSGQGCDFLRTENDLVKDNILMTIPYILMKDFRWVDLNLPDPESVPDGEEAVNEGDPRWAFVARSWMPDSATGEGGDNTIHQSYSFEVWLPRDEGGSLRMLALWTESELGGLSFDDDTVASITRGGIEDIFVAAEDWLDEN